MPLAYFVPYQWAIVQGLDKVVILYEYLHMFRVVSINGTHPADPDPTSVSYTHLFSGQYLKENSALFLKQTIMTTNRERSSRNARTICGVFVP